MEKTNCDNGKSPRGARISGPVLKCVILTTFNGQLVKRPLKTLGDLHNHPKASELTKNLTWSQNANNIDPPEGLGFLAQS